MGRLGASAADWAHFSALGLEQDLLPVVSDPTAAISPKSQIGSVGKVPSVFNADGLVVGIPKWTQLKTTAAEIQAWSKNDRLGISVQTRLVRAIDIDVDDEALASQIADAFQLELGALPIRSRPNSGKRLLVVKVQGAVRKAAFDVEGGRVEILGTGQQFVAVGTHPSGSRYVWSAGLPSVIPEVSLAEFEASVRRVSEFCGATGLRAGSTATPGERELDFDSQIALSRVDEDTMLDLRAALEFLGALIADDYNLWIKVGQALKTLDAAGFERLAQKLWRTFSSYSARYSPQQAEKKWLGFNPITTDFRAIFAEAYRRGWERPNRPQFEDDLTDAGNVEILAWTQGGSLRFINERARWIFWDEDKWQWDDSHSRTQSAVLAISDLLNERADCKRKRLQDAALDAITRAKLESQVKALQKWAKHSRSRKALSDCISVAERDERFVLSVRDLDRDPWLLGVDNGVVDLRSGELRPDAKGDFITRRCPVGYNPAASVQRWEQFVAEITGQLVAGPEIRPREQLASYVKRALGYCITGLTREQKMFLAVGEGSNGKNVLLDTIQKVLGPYAQSIPLEVMMVGRSQLDAERPSPVLAGLAGCRLAIASESRDGQRLDTAMVKRHTGGGTLTARFMRENNFTFEISHKLVLMTNHRPDIDQLDLAMRGRLHIIPFDVRWNRPGEIQRDHRLPDGDKTLAETLQGSLEGVLTWLVQGAKEYYEEGLEPPPEVLQVTTAYFEEQDLVARFLAECERCDPDSGVRAMTAHNAFSAWAAREGETIPMTPKSFANSLRRNGIERKKRQEGSFYGIRLPAADGGW